LKGAALAFALGAGLVSSCSSMGEDAIYNDSGRTLEIRMTPRWPWSPKTIALPPGGHAEVFRGAKPGGYLILAAGRCLYTYDLPLPEREYWPMGGYDSTVRYQMESDLTALLLPFKATTVALSAELARVQGRGFPALPIKSNCR
jgi:hypothetical protein